MRQPEIERSEYLERQERARALARHQGFDAIVAWSRGGSTQDHYADVYYLTGFYTHYPFIPDLPSRWRARGHTALFLPVNGRSTLLVDVARRQEPEPVADCIEFSEDIITSLVRTLVVGLSPDARVALLGGEALAWRWGQHLAQVCAEERNIRLVEVDELGVELRLLKTPAEIETLRAAGIIGTRAVTAAMNAAEPGATEAEVAAAAIEEIVRAGAALYGLGLSSGKWAHTFSPSSPAAYDARRRLARGEMVRLHLYGSLDGYLFDFGRSRVVGQEPTQLQQEILDAVRDSVNAGTAFLHPGRTLGDIAQRCEDVLAASSYVQRHGLPRATMGGAWGHALGLDWGPPWIERASTVVIRPGMYLAIERRVEAPGIGGANYENNVLITEGGPEVFTPAPDDFQP
jgi:ectoine hydrolase